MLVARRDLPFLDTVLPPSILLRFSPFAPRPLQIGDNHLGWGNLTLGDLEGRWNRAFREQAFACPQRHRTDFQPEFFLRSKRPVFVHKILYNRKNPKSTNLEKSVEIETCICYAIFCRVDRASCTDLRTRRIECFSCLSVGRFSYPLFSMEDVFGKRWVVCTG